MKIIQKYRALQDLPIKQTIQEKVQVLPKVQEILEIQDAWEPCNVLVQITGAEVDFLEEFSKFCKYFMIASYSTTFSTLLLESLPDCKTSESFSFLSSPFIFYKKLIASVIRSITL